jgi:hypothetical protein
VRLVVVVAARRAREAFRQVVAPTPEVVAAGHLVRLVVVVAAAALLHLVACSAVAGVASQASEEKLQRLLSAT